MRGRPLVVRSLSVVPFCLLASLLGVVVEGARSNHEAHAQLPPLPSVPGLPPLPSTLPTLSLPGLPTAPTTASGTLTARVVDSKSTGDFKMSAGVAVGPGGSLTISMPAIRHPDSSAPVSPLTAMLSVTGSASGGASIVCSIGGISAGANVPVDLAFIDDTTGSMSGTVHGVSDSVKRFAQDIADRGVDARFAMVTFGDAFATQPASGFAIGHGDFAPPKFDLVARPYVGFGGLDRFTAFLDEMKASKILGDGGNDEPENPLGALEYAWRSLGWRAGAARVFIAITDTVAHQAGDKTTFITAPWTPPSGEQAIGDLDGDAVVHVVARDRELAPFFQMRALADGTGGATLTLPADGRVDLGKLGLKDWLVNGFRGVCSGAAAGTIELNVHATIVGKRLYEGNLHFKIVVN
ncbi:MAG: vWA domain-containing protein [Polyangiales bacterium]